tara:strand:+ start:2386 stop:2778 length:393 start_codon:yes stop_codon:yes gene_type:complete
LKKLTLFIGLLVSTTISSSCFADWARIAENIAGNTFYVDFQKIHQADGYVYFWLLNDYASKSAWGYLSSTAYVQGDCNLFRYKNLTWTIYKQPMAAGDNHVSIKPPDEWLHPSSNQSDEIILEIICKGRN